MSDTASLTPPQCKAGRAILGLTREDLSKRAEVSATTIADFELGRRMPYERTLRDIQTALEDTGVAFIAADETGGPGVRLKKAE